MPISFRGILKKVTRKSTNIYHEVSTSINVRENSLVFLVGAIEVDGNPGGSDMTRAIGQETGQILTKIHSVSPQQCAYK